jgi:acetyl esterase/lipase
MDIRDVSSPLVSPLGAPKSDLVRLPPAAIYVCREDVLYDDGKEWSTRLEDAE